MSIIAHRVEGEGPPLLLLNGIAMSMVSWGPIAEGLAQRFRVIRCDLRGQLLSPGAHADLSEHLRDLLALLDELEVDRAHVVGTSFGGAIGALLAARFPGRVESLVSIASTAAFDRGMAVEIGRWRIACEEVLEGASGSRLAEIIEPVAYSETYLESHREERARSRKAMDALPRAWFADLITLMDSTRGVDLEAELDQIRCPTLIAAAKEDAFIPRSRCRALAEKISGARFEIIPGAGHAVVVEDPEGVLRLIRSFLRSIG